ncbi:hypothetical protein A1Q1_02636 [Trichosporon asahii var. asahii CBS 2479]|uniref:Uncharacterized protein n=1 Tax=Trichosporon asahii var. asahii (strain ATCC 90039 / CBS 2479 / JCM 2466 / KCTC 7840 / NBRC 103889/ NCYC 2677 / UAMH 7654) TaxID=1186058 RepID=J5QP03_TRIAS|nr:hypothetical protein A1Q1_02636 [Trichosporon asahii var. asahii CBS 2479]EJT48353.1 hypothetical protein A1Q1_02636 [Trichosporon asahii var. asahii CBS 2479]
MPSCRCAILESFWHLRYGRWSLSASRVDGVKNERESAQNGTPTLSIGTGDPGWKAMRDILFPKKEHSRVCTPGSPWRSCLLDETLTLSVLTRARSQIHAALEAWEAEVVCSESPESGPLKSTLRIDCAIWGHAWILFTLAHSASPSANDPGHPSIQDLCSTAPLPDSDPSSAKLTFGRSALHPLPYGSIAAPDFEQGGADRSAAGTACVDASGRKAPPKRSFGRPMRFAGRRPGDEVAPLDGRQTL